MLQLQVKRYALFVALHEGRSTGRRALATVPSGKDARKQKRVEASLAFVREAGYTDAVAEGIVAGG
jgi:hypothetical protein